MLNFSGKKHRLVFLTVNCSYSHSSLALPLLHNACRDLDNWEWLRYDMTNDGNILDAVRDITRYNCDLLATDLYLFNRQTALDILQRCHTLQPECRIAVGGPECLGEGAEALMQTYPWLDRIFRGEGEKIFHEYLENFDNNRTPASRIMPPDHNALQADWADSDSVVNDEFFTVDKPFVQIETSRGCPMKCFYCTSGGTQTRYRTLEQVREELQKLSGKGVREIRVLDRTFNLPQERGAELLRLFRTEFKHIKFHLELHPQFLNKALREELTQALPGQLHVEVGIQCLDNTVQKLSGRCSNAQAALDGLKFLCQQDAFDAHADLLAGLPEQKWKHILNDTATLMSINTAEIQLEVLKVLPGTPLCNIASKHGILYNPATPYDVMQSSTMSLQDIQYARDLSRLLDLTYNHRCLHDVLLAMYRELPDLVKKLLDFFHHNSGNSSVVWDLKKRFLFLWEFCKMYQLETSQQLLAFQWLSAGFQLGQGPDIYSCKTAEIPPDAQLYYGNAQCIGERESRYWSFAMPGKTYFLAYNRSYALNRPAAIWVKKSAGALKNSAVMVY